MTRRLVLVLVLALVACACPNKAGQGTTGGSGTVPVESGSCEGVRAKVEQLYRAEAQAKEPKRVEEAVADNTQMVIRPARFPPRMSVSTRSPIAAVVSGRAPICSMAS